MLRDEDGSILIHHMDIKEPLSNLKVALEEVHGISLEGYDFYLQDTTLVCFILFVPLILCFIIIICAVKF